MGGVITIMLRRQAYTLIANAAKSIMEVCRSGTL
jgi:hypothetical protein